MKQRKDIIVCFLILHYKDAELTKMAVESIQKLDNFNNCQIVIVDNGSLNGSGQVLKNWFESNGNIHIIISDDNLGFSAGNNLGFAYIKEHFESKFVIAMNNDVIMCQKDFLMRLQEVYDEAPFWVAGPDIFVPQRSVHTSPLYLSLRKVEDVEEAMEAYKRKIEIYKRNSFWTLKEYIVERFEKNKILNILFRIKSYIKRKHKYWDVQRSGVVLQGSCVIFDQRYCENNDELFIPMTFLYGEEDFLASRCCENSWEIRYFPELQVWHLERGSAKHVVKSYKEFSKKRIARCELAIKALETYNDFLQGKREY